MLIEINPKSLLNLEQICEVLCKLHPSVLDNLVDMERSLDSIPGYKDLNNISMEEREFLADIFEKVDYAGKTYNTDKSLPLDEKVYDSSKYSHLIYEELKTKDLSSLTEEDKTQLAFSTVKDEYKHDFFHNLRKYIQLDTDEYIPIKIFVEVEDPVYGRKVKKLVRALETTRAPEHFYLKKKEMDEDAYFAEGYGLTMNEEKRKKSEKLFWGKDIEALKELLKKEKLYP